MASLNKVQIIGNLGRDVEMKEVGSTKVASFSVAVTEKFKDRNGQQQEKTEWVNIELWARLAEIAEQYLKKGSAVYVEGKLETQSWEKDGEKKYKTLVRGFSMLMLGSRGESQGQSFNQAPKAVEDDLPF